MQPSTEEREGIDFVVCDECRSHIELAVEWLEPYFEDMYLDDDDDDPVVIEFTCDNWECESDFAAEVKYEAVRTMKRDKMLTELSRAQWDEIFAASPGTFTYEGGQVETDRAIAPLRELSNELTAPQRRAIPLLLAGPLRYAPSEHPANARGHVRHDVLRRLVSHGAAVELRPDTSGPNPVYGYGATDLTYALSRILRVKRLRKSRRRASVATFAGRTKR